MLAGPRITDDKILVGHGSPTSVVCRTHSLVIAKTRIEAKRTKGFARMITVRSRRTNSAADDMPWLTTFPRSVAGSWAEGSLYADFAIRGGRIADVRLA